MVRDVQYRRLVGLGGVIEPQLIRLAQRVADRHLEITGVSLFAVAAQVTQLERVQVRVPDLPDGLVESLQAAVQRVLTVVLRQLVLRAVQGEAAVGDAVAIASHDGSEVGVYLEVAVQAVESEDHVGELAVPVRRLQAHDDGAVSHDSRLHAVLVGERVEFDRGPVGSLSEILLVHCVLSFDRSATENGDSRESVQIPHHEHSTSLRSRAGLGSHRPSTSASATLHSGTAPEWEATSAPTRFAKSAIWEAGRWLPSPSRNAAAKASPAPTVSFTRTT